MLGRICFLESRGWRVRLESEEIWTLPLLRAEIPTQESDRQLRWAARLLLKRGVRRVLTPAGFDRWGILAEVGLSAVETGDFCRTLAAPLALVALREGGIPPETATVALRGDRVTRAMRLAALALCPQVRNVVIAAPIGGEGLQSELRREYGVPALEERRGREPDVALHFTHAAGGGRILQLYGSTPTLEGFLFAPKEGALPGECDRLPLLAALWAAGRMDPGAMEIFSK